MSQPDAARESFRDFARESKTFFVLWAGQLVSTLGSGLTGFALPVWIYEKTGSAEQFGLLMFAALVPSLLVTPFAGALVDRWDRRTVLLASDALSAMMTLAIAALALSGRFEVWHLFVITALGSAMGAFQEPAFAAALRMLVSERHLGRAAGLMQTAGAATGLLTPLVAGLLVVTIGLGGVVLIDVATFLVAVGTLAVIRIPNPPPAEDAGAPKPSLWRDAASGWTFFRQNRGMLGMLVGLAVYNFWVGMVNPLVQPMLLAFTTPAVLGPVVSLSAAGSLLGSLAVGVWGGPKKRVAGILAVCAWSGACVALAGLRPSVPLVALGCFLIAVSSPVLGAASFALWMQKVPPDRLGRVFAVRRMIGASTMPAALLLAGPLAQRVFEPLMAPGGALADSAGRVIGVGPGRGIGLMYVLIGALMALTALAMFLVPSIRRLERDVPDAAPAPPPAEPALAAAGS